MTITIKGVPPSLNRFAGRENSWDYRREKQTWTTAVWAAARQCRQRPKAPYQFAVVEITYYFPNRNRHDADNYSGKFLLDGLTKAGVIVDDDFRHIKLGVSGDYDRDRPRTEITIMEVKN